MRWLADLTAQQLGWGSRSGTVKALLKWVAVATLVRWWFVSIRYFRPAEVDTLWGIQPMPAQLGWMPKTTLEELVAEMVAADVEEARKEAYLKRNGFAVVGARE